MTASISDAQARKALKAFRANPTKWRWRELQAKRSRRAAHYYEATITTTDKVETEWYTRREVHRMMQWPNYTITKAADGILQMHNTEHNIAYSITAPRIRSARDY